MKVKAIYNVFDEHEFEIDDKWADFVETGKMERAGRLNWCSPDKVKFYHSHLYSFIDEINKLIQPGWVFINTMDGRAFL